MTFRLAIGAGILLGACTQLPIPDSEPRQATYPSDESVRLAEPGADEVVIVINDNGSVSSHAGLFAGQRLSDPSGTYRTTRSEDKAWRGPTLRDYIAFQMNGGPTVRAYRFTLLQSDFAAIESRIAHAGWTMPMFCAARVRDDLAGIGPFAGLEGSRWTSPRELGAQLERIIRGPGKPGRCEMPDGRAC
jgi:hypothetical protein